MRFQGETTALIAHDLKSPLTAMTMNLEYALAELPDAQGCDRVREALADCRAASEKLERMIANMVDVERADRDCLSPRRSESNMTVLLASVAKKLEADASSREVHVRATCQPLSANVDAELVQRALVTLVDGALRSSRHGDCIAVSVDATPETLTVTVAADVPLMDGNEDPLSWQFALAVARAHDGSLEHGGRAIVLRLARLL